MANDKRDVNVVFLGPTGCGKSRLCNYLLDDDNAFEVNISFQSVTKGIQSKWKSITYNDELVTFKYIDTQGLADTTMTDNEVIEIIKEALAQDITYVNYFVIILKPGRLTDENRQALEVIIETFQLDDPERKKHVYFLLSHCESANEDLLLKYEAECLADRTIKRLLIVENKKAINLNCIGLPQSEEVNEWMYDGITKWMEIQREELMDYLCQPIEGIQPVKSNFVENLCSIL